MARQKKKYYTTLKGIYERFVDIVKKTNWYLWKEEVNDNGALFQLDNGFNLKLTRYNKALKQKTSLEYWFDGDTDRIEVQSLEHLFRII